MSGYELYLTKDPWQVMTLDVELDGTAFHAQAEIRYLAGGGAVVSEHPGPQQQRAAGEHDPPDLFLPFRHLRGGQGPGSLFCLRGTDEPGTRDPGKGNLTEFTVLWTDRME